MVVPAVLRAVGFLYALVVIGLLAYLWYSHRYRPWIGWLLLIVSAALGFLVFAPVAPWQFQQLALRDAPGLGAPLLIGAVGLALVFLLSFVFGRFFCGYACPVGALQEIAYHAPVPKIRPGRKMLFMIVRGIVFIVFVVLAVVFSASLLAFFGIHDFFHLVLSAGAVLFIVLLLISLFFYRPFCRLVCPYGFILSFAAAKSIFRLRRTGACIECKKCEKACPVDEAQREDAKAECYLCGRCTAVCPKEGALVYSGNEPPQK